MNVQKKTNEEFIEEQGETSHSGNVQNKLRCHICALQNKYLGSLRGVKELSRSRLRNDAYQFENANDGGITDSVCANRLEF